MAGPTPTGEFETLKADTVILALGQTTDIAFLRQVPGIEFAADGTIIVGDDMQTGHPGIFAGGDVTPATRTVTNATGQGKRAARHIDRVAARRGAATIRSPPRDPVRRAAPAHVQRHAGAARNGGAARRAQGFRRGRDGTRRRPGATRSRALSVLWQLLRMRQLLRRMPRGRHHQARVQAAATRST